MKRTRLFSSIAIATALAMVTVACGQKAGVHVASGGSGGVDESGNPIAYDAQGNPILLDEQGNPISGAAGAAGGAAGSTTRSRTGGGTATTVGGGGGGSGTTKVWGDTITVGIHAPITGAAPLPNTFAPAAAFVKNWVNQNVQLPGGRKIDIQIVDDQYQPASAASRCSELIKQKNAFLLVGAAGTDQIQACARVAAQAGVPYLSAGATENQLRGLKNYFAISMSYKEQGAYLAKYMKQTFPDRAADPASVYMVYSNTPNFLDAKEGFEAAFPGVKFITLPRTPSGSDLNTAARTLCTSSPAAKIAYPLMAPKDWLILIGQQTCDIQWSGVGVTMGVNEVAQNGCKTTARTFDGSVFFSPIPGEDKAPTMDPEFGRAVANEKWDDIYIALWNLARTLAILLQKTGAELTRANFVNSTENAKNVSNGLGPTLNYTPTNHFGANEAHVLRAKCVGGKTNSTSGGKYETPTTFLKY